MSEDTITERYCKALPIHWQQQFIHDGIKEGPLTTMQMTALTLERMESVNRTTEWPEVQSDRKSHDGGKGINEKKSFITQKEKKQ